MQTSIDKSNGKSTWATTTYTFFKNVSWDFISA